LPVTLVFLLPLRKLLRKARQDGADVLPRAGQLSQALALEVPVFAVGVAGEEAGAPEDLEDLFRPAVDELGAQLDRVGAGGVVEGVDAAADALAGLEDGDEEPGPGTGLRRRPVRRRRRR
jgi:hypothetical protein